MGAEHEDTDEDYLTLRPTISHTNESLLKTSHPRGKTTVMVVEIAALLGLLSINLAVLLTHAWGRNGTLAAASEVVVWGYILTLALLRLVLSNTGYKLSPHLWNHTAVLYGLQWLFTVVLFRSAIIHPSSARAQILMTLDFIFVTILFGLTVSVRKGNKASLLEYENDLEPSHEPTASLISLATFSFVDAIVWKGYKQTLEIQDVWDLIPKDKAANVLADFRQTTKTSYLAWRLLKYFKRDLLIQALWAVFSGLFTFAPTLLLKAILEYVEDPKEIPINAAWLYVILLGLSGCVTALADNAALWIGRKLCIRLRAIVIGEIYAKALRRKAAAASDTILGQGAKKSDIEDKSPNQNKLKKIFTWSHRKDDGSGAKGSPKDKSQKSDSQVNVGTIINLMAVDSFKVSELTAYLHFLWASVPTQIIVAIVLLYRILGYSSIAGIVTMFVLMPVNIIVARLFNRVQKRIMAATDSRIHTTNEVLQNIRIIKYFAWEHRFAEIVGEKRRVELAELRRKYILWSLTAIIWYGTPILITFLSFFIYTVIEQKRLIPSVAFTALSLFTILRYPLDQLADMLAHVQESKVSIDRVEEFLSEDETEKYEQLEHENGEDHSKIAFEKATLSWGGKDTRTKDGSPSFRMIGLDIDFRIGKLNIVVGPTGSGKTSLLMALLGEMTLLDGKVCLPGGQSREDLAPDNETGLTESVAYCAQQAWLVNDTIKQNILFASPWNKKRYNSVIDACALERDLQILDAGDQTLVGEKGITLSGGQKQRISLARALYCNSKHVLLDDCLSAVDSHTAKHIFEHCVIGPLMLNRTCILVTHNIALCLPPSQYVVVLANGKIATQGAPDVVMASGALGDEISRPTSNSGTHVHSRSDSAVHLDDQKTNGHNRKANGHKNGSAVPASKRATDKDDQKANTRTEGKAIGSVKWPVIKMYLASMGPWYFWIILLILFAGQQIGSVATNVWIREWANSYHTRGINTLETISRPPTVDYIRVSSNPYASSRLTGSTSFITLPFISVSSSDLSGFDAVSDEDVDPSYYLGIYALLGVLYIIICFFRFLIAFWGSLEASRVIHDRVLDSVARAKFRFFDTTPLGQLMNRFSRDLQAVDQEVAMVAVGVFHCLFSVVTIVILISVITPSFLIAGIIISLIYLAIGMFYINSSRDLKRLESVQRSPLYQQFGETLTGVVTIRAYRDERRFIRENQDRVNAQNRPFIYLWATNRWLSFRIDYAGALVSFFAGAFVILSIGKLDAGAAGLSLTYAVTFNENILWLVRLYAANEQNMNSVERMKEYLDVEQEAKAVIPETRPNGNWPSHGAVEFISYSTRYRSDLGRVLKSLTFKINAGDKIGIVGRTGAGKSSLALALFRGLEADEGKILIDDVDIGLIGLQDLRESITIVPQDPTLFTGTIRSNLDPFGLFTDEEIFTALRRVQLIGAFATNESSQSSSATLTAPSKSSTSSPTESNTNQSLSKVLTNTHENTNVFANLLSPVAESGSNLSQGQKQLLCLARALLKSPRVLLMDEATASIDYATDAKIQRTLRELEGSTIITIAHRLQTIADYDKVLVLDKGEIIEYDAPWELIAREGGNFRGMCEISGELEGLTEIAMKARDKKKLIDV